MKYLLYIIFIAVVISGGYGFYIKNTTGSNSEKFIGFAVLGLFFIWMPLFIYHRYKGKDVKKYMINDETFKKIKDEADNFLE